MPHIANTPESILPRSDSRNPAVTCSGITTNGRTCRRALASPSSLSSASSPAKGARPQNTELSALFCWQHKDQAASCAVEASNQNDSIQQIQRSSMDTVMDRLGILDIDDSQGGTKPKRGGRSSGKHRKPRRTFCCFELVDEEDSRPSKPAQTHTTHPHAQRSSFQHQQRQGQGPGRSQVPHGIPPTPNLGNSQRQKRNSSRAQPPSLQRNRDSSQTQTLLSWVPPSLSPQTTSLLLTELAKPISDADEAGYIYMFWVTPPASSPPPPDVASSLLPPAQAPSNRRSVSDAIQAADGINALASKPTSQNPGTIRLKIGRTSNVQRRLNEWTRQCSHNLTLIRYYPYTPSGPTSSPGRHSGHHGTPEPGRKVPHVHRVERLIHIELNDVRVRDLERCGECNRAHREWFEIAAEKNALRRVEECIRRWVRWGESQ
jgi:hypothetical protein